MLFDTPQQWFEYLHNVERLVMDDVEDSWRRMDAPMSQLRPVQEVLKRSLERHLGGGADRWFQEFRRDWFVGQKRSLQEVAYGQRQLSESVKDLESRLTERLTRIEGQLSEGSNGCRFEGSSAGMPWTGKYVSIAPSETGQKAKANPQGFMDKLRKVAKDARVLVLAEPYALADANDSGDKGDCLGQIHALIQDLSIDQLHLYCRQDASSLGVVMKLEHNKDLCKKISIHVGDVHDRYLLSGTDEKGDQVLWHDCSRWKGSTFGASLNGISKRPTYVVPFEQGDIVEVKRYLDDHTAPKSLKDLKKDLQKNLDVRNAARAARAHNAGDVPSVSD